MTTDRLELAYEQPAFDTNVVGWGLLGRGNPKQANLREMIYRARMLLDLVRGRPVIFPCVALGEVLTPVSSENRGGFTALLRRRLTFVPFGEAAAAISADLFARRGELTHRKAKRSDIRVDTMIVASAKVAGAKGFFSNDAGCREVAALAGLIACDLPTRHPDIGRDRVLRHAFGLTPVSEPES